MAATESDVERVEAEVREAREIREHRPRFNKRGKKVRTPVWVKVTLAPSRSRCLCQRRPRSGSVSTIRTSKESLGFTRFPVACVTSLYTMRITTGN